MPSRPPIRAVISEIVNRITAETVLEHQEQVLRGRL